MLTVADNLDQVWTGREPLSRIAYGRLEDGLQIETPMTGYEIAPALERTRDGHGQIAKTIFLPRGFKIIRPGLRHWGVHVRCGGGWRHGVVVYNHDVAGAGVVEIDEASSKDTHHHGLHDRQGKGRGHGSVDGVPPHGEHLQARRGSQGMIRGYHPTRSHCGLFLRGKWTTSLVAPCACHRFSFSCGRGQG